MTIDYKTWYAAAKEELQRLQEERTALEQRRTGLDKQIAALTWTLNGLAPLVGEEPLPPPAGAVQAPAAGITDSIRAVLAEADRPLSAGEIRDQLRDLGFDTASYSNVLATIHTVLRRLREAGEIESSMSKIAGKDFTIGGVKGFVGIGWRKHRRKASPGP